MTLALVRHGRTAWNLERRLQGRSDIALDAHGELQAHAAGRLLARAQWGRVVTSPLTRAAQTASIIGSYFGSPTGSQVAPPAGARAVSLTGPHVDPTSDSGVAPTTVSRFLSPIDAGLGGAVPFVEPGLLERDFGEAEGMQVAEAAERWPAGDYPGSETAAELSERAGSALTALLMGPGTAIVVSHGVFLRAGIEAVTGAGCPRILNGQVVLLERTSGRPTARFLGE